MDLNDKQKIVANTLDKNIFLAAPAGTGKTRVLSERVFNIVNNGLAKEDEILCITFTNKAAKEMKDRIEKRLGGRVKSTIKTFHSFCLEIIKSHAKNKTDIPSDFNVCDEEDAKEAVKKIATIQRPDYNKSFIDITMMHAFINHIKEYRLKFKILSDDEEYDYKVCLKQLSDPSKRDEVARCFKSNGHLNMNLMRYMLNYGDFYVLFYNKQLRSDKSLDFNDLVTYTHLLFRNNDIVDYYKQKYKFINIDEVQDSATCC